MAQTGFTPILLYASGTATNVPSASNLTNSTNGSELAINYADGKLFYKDSGGNVQTIASKSAASGSFSQITSTVATGTAPLVVTSTTPVANLSIGGNAATATSATSATNLAGGAANQIGYQTGAGATSFIAAPTTSSTYLQWNGTGFTWAAAGSAGVTSFSAGTTGFTPSTGTTGTVTLAGTLNIANGGTGQTTASAAFNALSPITSTGDLIIGNGTNSATRLAIGTSGYVLTSNGTTASWAAATGGVTQIIAGTNVTISPAGGTGAVTINATGSSSSASIGLIRAIAINCIFP